VGTLRKCALATLLLFFLDSKIHDYKQNDGK